MKCPNCGLEVVYNVREKYYYCHNCRIVIPPDIENIRKWQEYLLAIYEHQEFLEKEIARYEKHIEELNRKAEIVKNIIQKIQSNETEAVEVMV